ncbi:MAG: hypothetical protein EBR20_04355 [Bacteroidetes bacterium]|nr:hypothetical protein [Bacteroidota bacterium]
MGSGSPAVIPVGLSLIFQHRSKASMMAKTPEGMTYRAFLVTLPLHRPIPVGGVSWTERPVVLIRAEDSEGRTAWGEAAPLDGYGSDTLADVLDALSQPEWTRTNRLPSLVCALGILKPSLMGSPVATMALARRVQAAGRRVTVSSAFESQVGMIMVTRLAALIGDTAPGLGTYAYMADDWGRRAPWWDETSVSIERLPAIPRSAVVPGPSPMARRRFASGLKVEEVSR